MAKENKKELELSAPEKLKILVTIVDRTKTDFYLSALEGYEVNLQTVIYGKGTAPTQIKRHISFLDSDKSVILSAVKESRLKEILNDYEDKFFKTKHGKGVAFTIPVSSLIGVSIYQFLCNINLGGE